MAIRSESIKNRLMGVSGFMVNIPLAPRIGGIPGVIVEGRC
jgi:hypothetical protein